MLPDLPFQKVWGASGVQGFFGDPKNPEYWFHPLLRPFGLRFDGSTFTAKTATIRARAGNMPLDSRYRPKERFPRCVYIDWRRAIALNAVGLANPGAKVLFEDGRWQKRTQPFFVSFAAVGETMHDRLQEIEEFVKLFLRHRDDFRAEVGLQLNLSCPNTEAHQPKSIGELAQEAWSSLRICSVLNVPIVPKINILFPWEVVHTIDQHPAVSAICVTNTIPWGTLAQRINWEGIFGSAVSPVAERLTKPGGALGPSGGLSGRVLLPLLCEWITEARSRGIKRHINGGGGILSVRDAARVLASGANSISLGSIAFLRPQNVAKVVCTFSGRV